MGLILDREKELITSIRAGKTLIESLKAEAEKAERGGDLERVGAIRFGELPEAQQVLVEATERLNEAQSGGALLPEAVDAELIAGVVSRWTGIPTAKLLETERDKLLHMEESLRTRVIGQEEALEVVSDAVRRARAGLQDTSRPIGSFMFLGPTGVGKTELCKALAEFLFDDGAGLIGGKRRQLVLKGGKIARHLLAQQIRAGGEGLSQLDETGSGFVQRAGQPLAGTPVLFLRPRQQPRQRNHPGRDLQFLQGKQRIMAGQCPRHLEKPPDIAERPDHGLRPATPNAGRRCRRKGCAP